MKRAVLLLVAACQSSPGDDYPIGPGGGGPVTPGRGGDAGAGDAGDGGDAGDAGGIRLRGRVCLLADLRTPTVCDDAQHALGLRVSLGTRTTTTLDDRGSFEIDAPQGAGFTWHVESATADRIERTAMPFGTDNTIPAISVARYVDLLNGNSAVVGALQGSIVVRVVSGSASVRGVTASLAGVDQVFYDGASKTDWNTGTVGTGANGVVWMPGVTTSVPVGPVTVVLSPPGAVARSTQATVEDQTITFVTADLE